MRTIKKNGTTIALVFDGKFEEGTKPITDENWPLQILSLKHEKGKVLDAHSHKPKHRETEKLMEALMVFSGKVKIDVYFENSLIETVELRGNQGVMVVNGGIGIEVIEAAEMMEFKNGPFVEDKVVL